MNDFHSCGYTQTAGLDYKLKTKTVTFEENETNYNMAVISKLLLPSQFVKPYGRDNPTLIPHTFISYAARSIPQWS